MKKTILVSGLVFFALVFFSQGLRAQRIYRDNPRAADPYNFLNLSQEQMERIDKLDLELDNELSPIFSKLRSAYFELEELEYQRNPDQTAIDKQWATIQSLETEIQNKEDLYDEKARSLLTTEQQKMLDSYCYSPRQDLYVRGGRGQGYYGRGGRGYGRGYGSPRLGRGPCGAGLGRLPRWRSLRNR